MNGYELRQRLLAGEKLPDGLTVGGWLYLEGCTALTALPDGLSVGDWLDLRGCTALASLPDGLSVGRELELSGCTALTALPDGLTVGDWLELSGCTALTALPDGLSVGGDWIGLGGCDIRRIGVTVDQQLPDTLMAASVGRRLGDVFSHRLITRSDFYDAVITLCEIEDWDHRDCTTFQVDRDLLTILASPKRHSYSIEREAA